MDLLEQACHNLEETLARKVTEAALAVVESTSELPDRSKQLAASRGPASLLDAKGELWSTPPALPSCCLFCPGHASGCICHRLHLCIALSSMLQPGNALLHNCYAATVLGIKQTEQVWLEAKWQVRHGIAD